MMKPRVVNRTIRPVAEAARRKKGALLAAGGVETGSAAVVMDRPNGVRTERAGVRGRVKTRRRTTENKREDILQTDRRRRR